MALIVCKLQVAHPSRPCRAFLTTATFHADYSHDAYGNQEQPSNTHEEEDLYGDVMGE